MTKYETKNTRKDYRRKREGTHEMKIGNGE